MHHVCEKKFMQQGAMKLLSFAFVIVPVILCRRDVLAQALYLQTQQPQQQTAGARADQTPRSADAANQRQPASLVSSAPIWPANQPPIPAIVRWDSRGLEIEASNSSLEQILHQVASETGVRWEGLTQDQRIFGSYGPGPGCDVLSKLLEGSGYNVLIIGSRDADAPLKIVLSTRLPLNPQMIANNRNRSYSAVSKPIEPQQPADDPSGAASAQPNSDPYNVGGAPRDPVESMQEILQRQQVIDQQQQPQQQDQRNSTR